MSKTTVWNDLHVPRSDCKNTKTAKHSLVEVEQCNWLQIQFIFMPVIRYQFVTTALNIHLYLHIQITKTKTFNFSKTKTETKTIMIWKLKLILKLKWLV